MGYISQFSGQLKTTRKLSYAEYVLLDETIKKSNLEGCLGIRKDNKTLSFWAECKCDANDIAQDLKNIMTFCNSHKLTINGLIHAQGEGFHDLSCIKVIKNKILVLTGKVVYSKPVMYSLVQDVVNA